MDAFKEDPERLYKEISAHLAQVSESPQTPLDTELLKRTERSLDTSTPQGNLWSLLETGETLLQTLQQDPTPLTRLLREVIDLIPFDSLKTSITPATLIAGLSSPSAPIQILCLAYLSRASSTPSGAAFVAASSSLVACLISTWFSSGSAEVADAALRTIILLLSVDQPNTTTFLSANSQTQGSAQGQGLLWRRLFHDPEVYSLFFTWTTLTPSLSTHPDPTTKKGLQAISLAQARLYDFLVRAAALDWTAATTTSLPDIEQEYARSTSASDQPYGGLLRYAASDMIDPEDYLMSALREDFFVQLLSVLDEQGPQMKASPRQIQAIKDQAGVDDEPEENSGVHL